ncbi:MAG: NAD+ kinase [Planctomycetota bacterium]
MPIEKIILLTRKTRLDLLIERFNTLGQAKFYIERSGADFADYEREHAVYQSSLNVVRERVDGLAKIHSIERGYLANFLFTEKDMVVAVGQDGLVVNAAKYLNGQPVVAVNPDPQRFDGVLLPFLPQDIESAVTCVLKGQAKFRPITMAEAVLSDGQKLLAFNDLFIGRRGHASAFYAIEHAGRRETQSSSGIIVSTGAGSTGWLSSIYNMMRGMNPESGAHAAHAAHASTSSVFAWEAEQLRFVVREPFASRSSQAGIVTGDISPDQPLTLESRTPEGGVIFSDGVENDFVNFNSGTLATIQISKRKTMLVVK